MPRRETTLSSRKPEASQDLSYNSRQLVIPKMKYQTSSIGRSCSRVEGAKPFKDTCLALLWRLPAQLPEAIQHQFVFSFAIVSMPMFNCFSAQHDRGYGNVCHGGLQAPEVKPQERVNFSGFDAARRATFPKIHAYSHQLPPCLLNTASCKEHSPCCNFVYDVSVP